MWKNFAFGKLLETIPLLVFIELLHFTEYNVDVQVCDRNDLHFARDNFITMRSSDCVMGL